MGAVVRIASLPEAVEEAVPLAALAVLLMVAMLLADVADDEVFVVATALSALIKLAHEMAATRWGQHCPCAFIRR